MNNPDLYTQFANYTDKLQMLRALLSYPMINWVSQFFSRTRNAEMQLYFVEYCRAIIAQNADSISRYDAVFDGGCPRQSEYEKYDRALICFELSAYDRLNLWMDYIALFEQTRKEKAYVMTYSSFRDDPVFNEYLLRHERGCKYVHFLYSLDRRYKIICRKQERREWGKTTEHLKRRQQNQLTDEELESRYGEMERLFEFIKQTSARQGKRGFA